MKQTNLIGINFKLKNIPTMKESYFSELMSFVKLKYYISEFIFNYVQQLLYLKEERRPSQGRFIPRLLHNKFV